MENVFKYTEKGTLAIGVISGMIRLVVGAYLKLEKENKLQY